MSLHTIPVHPVHPVQKSGIQTRIINPWTSQVGGSAASKILEQLTSLGLHNRGTQIRNAKEDNYPDGSAADYYAVIRHCKEYGIPGIIVEHAYV